MVRGEVETDEGDHATWLMSSRSNPADVRVSRINDHSFWWVDTSIPSEMSFPILSERQQRQMLQKEFTEMDSQRKRLPRARDPSRSLVQTKRYD